MEKVTVVLEPVTWIADVSGNAISGMWSVVAELVASLERMITA